jgi:hypothetical protein
MRALDDTKPSISKTILELPVVSCSGEVEKQARLQMRNTRPSISGDHGHFKLYRAASILVNDFLLSDDDAYSILASEFNPRCCPPWEPKDLKRKVAEVRKNAHKHVVGYGINWSYDIRWSIHPELIALCERAQDLVPIGGFDMDSVVAGAIGDLVVAHGWKRGQAVHLVHRILAMRTKAAGGKRSFKDLKWAGLLSKWLGQLDAGTVVTPEELLVSCLGVEDTRVNRIRLGKAMKFLGWSKVRGVGFVLEEVDPTSTGMSTLDEQQPSLSTPEAVVDGQAYVLTGGYDDDELDQDQEAEAHDAGRVEASQLLRDAMAGGPPLDRGRRRGQGEGLEDRQPVLGRADREQPE